MELYFRKFLPILNPTSRKILYQFYKIYAFFRYFYYFNKFLPFRNIYVCIGRDLSMLPQIKLELYEKTEIDLLESLIPKSDCVFWDIGANVGLYSIIFSKLNPHWRIYSFEPNIGVHKYFYKNINYNRCDNIELMPFALLDSEKKLDLRVNYFRPGVHSLETSRHKFKRSILADCVTGDELYLSGKVPAPNFLKIDVQGSELKVLHGIETIISRYKPIISIEIDPVAWKNKVEFNLYLNKINELLAIYPTGIMISNRSIKKIKSIEGFTFTELVQTLILINSN